jgi:hypothetical protein
MCMFVRLNVHAYLKRPENTGKNNSVCEKICSKEIHYKTPHPQQSSEIQSDEDIKINYTMETTIIRKMYFYPAIPHHRNKRVSCICASCSMVQLVKRRFVSSLMICTKYCTCTTLAFNNQALFDLDSENIVK